MLRASVEGNDEQQEEELFTKPFTLKKTRKAFFPEYLSASLLIFLLFILRLQNTQINKYLFYALVSIIIIAIGYAEFSRLLIRYKITKEKVTIISGILTQHKKNVYFHPLGFVTDINVKQGRLQRILSYGTIFIKGSGEEHSLEIKDVDYPHKIMEIIEHLIEVNRTPSSKRGNLWTNYN